MGRSALDLASGVTQADKIYQAHPQAGAPTRAALHPQKLSAPHPPWAFLAVFARGFPPTPGALTPRSPGGTLFLRHSPPLLERGGAGRSPSNRGLPCIWTSTETWLDRVLCGFTSCAKHLCEECSLFTWWKLPHGKAVPQQQPEKSGGARGRCSQAPVGVARAGGGHLSQHPYS